MSSCNKRRELLRIREKLPVYKHKDEFFELLDTNQCVLVVGETGSGKTTQIPQWCVEYLEVRRPSHGIYNVCCTQPRRVAAVSVANRVAEEVGTHIGDLVGYSIRFEDCSSDNTLLKYMTDGVLLREVVRNQAYINYGIVILDEAHERSICTDVLLGFLKDIVRENPEFRVVIMSATADSKSFKDYFFDCPLLNVSGRVHEVTVYHTIEPVDDYVESAVIQAVDLHCSAKQDGDILIFVTGQEDCELTCNRIKEDMCSLVGKKGHLECIPIYSALPVEEQKRIFDPPPPSINGKKGRKCIVATNIAETSLTIDNVACVIDCGFKKEKIFNPITGLESLLTIPISQASAIQRAGRCGRTNEGICIRLYEQEVFEEELIEQSYPEILTCNMANVVIFLKSLGIDNVATFDYITPPSPQAMIHALDLLYDLEAIDEDGNLTEIGTMIAALPLEPPLAKVLIVSALKYGCSYQVASMVALLSCPTCFLYPVGRLSQAKEVHDSFWHEDGDHMTLVNLFGEYISSNESAQWCYENFISFRTMRQAKSIRDQLFGVMARIKLPIKKCKFDAPDLSERVRKSVLEGYCHHIGVATGNNNHFIVQSNDVCVKLHPKSGLKSTVDWIVYHENLLTYDHFIVTASSIEIDWLFEIAPRKFKELLESPSTFFVSSLRTAVRMSENKKEQGTKRKNWL
ncbi:RNA helicase [Aphelenchoides besseyi]|nr:RNA helicase [Aphelenchoides besseyi]